MYTEIQKAGVKHFFIALAAAAALSAVTFFIRFFTRAVPLIGQTATVAAVAALAYLVYAHYAPVFEYTLDGHRLTVTRRTGRREKKVTVRLSQIVSVSDKAPANVKTDRLCPAVFFAKNPLYINYGSRTVLIDGSSELYGHLKNAMNGDKRWQK